MLLQLTAGDASMADVAALLAAGVHRPVVDRTGLPGHLTVELEFAPLDSDTPGPSVFSVVEKQLGLKLVSARGPRESMVIDRVQKPSSN